jgi:hypothetical protein
MNEKEIKELSENITESIINLSLGKEPNLISGKVFKTIAHHPKFNEIKNLYINFLEDFDGKYETPEELKKLTDFRFSLFQLYIQE